MTMRKSIKPLNSGVLISPFTLMVSSTSYHPIGSCSKKDFSENVRPLSIFLASSSTNAIEIYCKGGC